MYTRVCLQLELSWSKTNVSHDLKLFLFNIDNILELSLKTLYAIYRNGDKLS